MQRMTLVGIVLIFLGFFLVLFGSMFFGSQEGSNIRFSIGGFIGPIPFGWANDRALMIGLMAAAVFVLVVWFLLSSARFG